jgi:hypothetical protein
MYLCLYAASYRSSWAVLSLASSILRSLDVSMLAVSSVWSVLSTLTRTLNSGLRFLFCLALQSGDARTINRHIKAMKVSMLNSEAGSAERNFQPSPADSSRPL